MINEIIIAVAILVGLGLFFATVIAISYKKLKVDEDPRIDKVEEMLPGNNCGACGQPGCRAFAENVVGGKIQPSNCTVSSEEGIETIADFLGVKAGDKKKKVARLLCAGGVREAHNLANYSGNLKTCRGESVVAGGVKECTWGCLGLGDCSDVCDFNAITMNDDGLPKVDINLCTACGDCVDICPKNLFVLMPVDHHLIVQCKSLLEGDEAISKCSVACNACGRCAADALPELIEMKNNLPVIDYSKNNLATKNAIKRCPTGAIVWVGGNQFEKKTTPKIPLGRMETLEDIKYEYYQ